MARLELKEQNKGSSSFFSFQSIFSLLHFPTEEVKQKAKEKQEKKELKGPQWKVTQQRATKKRRPVYQYKTVDQLLSGSGHAMRDSDSEDELPQQKTAGVKIIDMTGKSQRIITDTRQGGNFGSAKSAFSDRGRQIFRSTGIRSAEPSIFVGKIGEIGKSAESGKI